MIASCQPVRPSESRWRWAASSAWYQSSSVTSGSSPATSRVAPSWSMPVGWPAASRSIRPSAGSGVAAVMPASSSARELTQAPCPSRFGR